MAFFTAEHYKQGLTMGIGSIIICSIIFQDAVLSEFKELMPPAIALVLWSTICPAYSGMATISYPLILIGLILAVIAYLIIIYGTYAVTGPDYSPSTEKGIAMSVIGTVVVALIHLLRVRVPALDTPGMLAQLLATIIAFLAYWVSVVLPPNGHIWQLIVELFLPVVTASIVSMFLVPNPAGQKCIGLMGQLLEVTAHLQNEMIQKLLLAEKEGKDGENNTSAVVDVDALSLGKKDNAANLPQEGRYVGIAAELEPVVVPMHKIDIQAWQIAVGINGLLTLSALEIDVYNKQHIFPRSAFRAVLTPIRIMEQLYISIVGFLQNGKMPSNKAFLLLRAELEEVKAAVEMSCKTLKQVIVDGYEYEKGLLDCLPRVEAACLALKEKMSENEKAQSGGGAVSDEFLVARELISLVILAGKEVRRAWEKVPALIAVRQPAAGAVAASFFAENKEEATSDAKKKALESSAVGSVVAPPQAAAAAAAAADSVSPPPQPFREVLKSTPSCSSFRQKLYLLSVRTGIHSWHWKIVLQMTVVFAISATLNVIPAVDDALHHRAYWIIITVMAIGDTTTGGIVDNGVQRIAGTAIGSVGIALTAGLGYLANGSTYEGSSVGKKLTEATIVTIWLATMKLFYSKYSPRLQKLFTIATLVVPLIAILDSTGEDVWSNIGYRIANTLIGVGIYTLASIVLFPVTAGDHIKEKTADCLLQVADMLEGITALPLISPPSSSSLEDASSSAAKKKSGGCFGLVNRRKKDSPPPTLEEDVEAAASVLEDVPEEENKASGGGGGGGNQLGREKKEEEKEEEEDAGAVAAKSIVNNGLQKAGTSLLDIIKLRDVVDKEYLVSKIYYKCVRKRESYSSSSSSLPLSSSQKSKDIDPEDEQLAQDLANHDQQQQSQKGSLCINRIFNWNKKSRPPMHVYHLDQLISHLKHNIVYSSITLHVREWLRSQKSFFTKSPELAVALKAFVQQSAECFRALRLAILGLVQPKEALQTVLNLRNMASDIGQICTNSEHFGTEETTVVHMMLTICRNIELLYRATDRALGTHDEPGIVSITDQELSKSEISILALLNVEATATAVQAVTVEEESSAAADDKKGGAGKTRDGVNELSGMMQTSTL